LSFNSSQRKIDEKFYHSFKSRIKKDFPEFLIIISEIEKEIDVKEAKEYLIKKEAKIKKMTKTNEDFNIFVLTKVLEIYIEGKKRFPTSKELEKSMKIIIKKGLPEFSKNIMLTLEQRSKDMLNYQRKFRQGFEKRLYIRWKEPLDLLESMIKVSEESGEAQVFKLIKTTNDENKFKQEALKKLHARALQISKEIFVLLRSGYADGAIARWRSLHELTVISLFLSSSDNIVSERYLEHEAIRKFREAKDYRDYYKKLGYPPIAREEFNKIKMEKERLCKKYSDKFKEEYGWIPSSIILKRDFRNLEKHIKFDKLQPFYNLACDSTHGGAKGFYRLGLMNGFQDKMLLVGPSNYGLSIPMQTTAISLSLISICLLNLEPDFESIISMQIMNMYVEKITIKSTSVEEQIEKEEVSKTKSP
jgi:D-ribose pyranose/furanose isomerase RbsD